MTRIIKTDNIGFCMGVRRALDKIVLEAEKRGHIETLGALVHNRQVLEQLEKLGVKTVNNFNELTGKEVVISAHGVGPAIFDELSQSGFEIIDTTCSYVKRAQKAAEKLNKDGFFTIVFGDANHPEVKGILGWANCNGIAILDASDLMKLNSIPRRIGIVSQTTQIPSRFTEFVKEIINIALLQDSEIRVVDTLCHDIRLRQDKTSKMASECELVYVIGGKTSANTKHLYELCAKHTKTIQIETEEDINPVDLVGIDTIGITAGASTDDHTINLVLNRLRQLTNAEVY